MVRNSYQIHPVDDVAAERDLLLTEKKGLETRLADAAASLEDLSRSGSPTKRDAAMSDREVLELKSKLAHQEDVAAAAVGKMRRSEALAQEVQKDIATEREKSVELHKQKAALEKAQGEQQGLHNCIMGTSEWAFMITMQVHLLVQV